MAQRSGRSNLKLRAIKSECCADNSRNPARDQIGIPRGFNSEYCARCLGIRTRRKDAGDGAPAFIPLLFQPGEAYQFDWSHEDVEIAGKPMRVKVAHMRLCASRAVYVRAYPRETQEMVFDAHARGFAFFGGVPLRGIYDNLWTPPAAR
jgi:transposase